MNMDATITLTSLAALAGIGFGVFTWLKSRDKMTSDKERETTELKVRLELYKEELDSLKARVDNLDTKLMQKVEDLSKKIDEIILKLMDKKG